MDFIFGVIIFILVMFLVAFVLENLYKLTKQLEDSNTTIKKCEQITTILYRCIKVIGFIGVLFILLFVCFALSF